MNKKDIQLLNMPIEIALRILLITSINKNIKFDIERLAYYDYICTRLNDYNSNYKSLHPENPYRKGEISIKRPLIKKAVLILVRKGLIEVKYDEDGICFIAKQCCANFMSQFKSPYFIKFKKNVIVGSELLKNKSNSELKQFFLDFSKTFEVKYAYENILRGDS